MTTEHLGIIGQRETAHVAKYGPGKEPGVDEPDEEIEVISYSDPQGNPTTDPDLIARIEASIAQE